MAYLGTQPNDVKKNTGLYTPSEILQLTKDGSWGGSLELIESQTVSSVSAINFTTLKGSIYDSHLFVYKKVRFNSSANNLSIRVSDDGGSSYESTNYQFAMMYASDVANHNQYRNNSASQIDIGLVGSTTSGHSMNGYFYMYNANNSSENTLFSGHGVSFASTVHHGQSMHWGGGAYTQGATVNALQLKGDGGDTIVTATVELFGIKEL